MLAFTFTIDAFDFLLNTVFKIWKKKKKKDRFTFQKYTINLAIVLAQGYYMPR